MGKIKKALKKRFVKLWIFVFNTNYDKGSTKLAKITAILTIILLIVKIIYYIVRIFFFR